MHVRLLRVHADGSCMSKRRQVDLAPQFPAVSEPWTLRHSHLQRTILKTLLERSLVDGKNDDVVEEIYKKEIIDVTLFLDVKAGLLPCDKVSTICDF